MEINVDKAAAYIAGLIRGREDVDSPKHPVWATLEEEYKESYRRRARRVLALAGADMIAQHIAEAEEKARVSYARSKWMMFGYWKAIAVHLRKVKREFVKGGDSSAT